MQFTEQDEQDIRTLKNMAEKLNRKGILADLLWSVFYQPTLQTLRKRLFGKLSVKKCGIYKIVSAQDERIYVGQSKDISGRFTEHVKAALKGTNDLFHREMLKQGPHNFYFDIIEECPEDALNEKEKYWIEFFESNKYGFNTAAGG